MASVLIVDDAAFMRMSIRKMIEDNGHSVAGEASNGVEAIEKYIVLKPDIVLLDISMPEMNGIEALRRIKEIDKDSKIIICSAMGQQQLLAQAVEFGVNDFIVKPFESSRLMAAIDKVLK